MQYFYRYIFLIVWIGYFVYWRMISGNVKTTVRTESAASRMVRGGSIILAILLLAIPKIEVPGLGFRFLPEGDWPFLAGLILPMCGLGFSVWGRRRLGRNWSQEVTIKDDHLLITEGPFALVRHPIYTGLILGFAGTSVALGEIRGLIADALVFGVLLIKLRLEERWLLEQFGEPYRRYCEKVSALIPFVL